MNERITELWNKAAESTAAYPSGQNTSWETQVNFMERFAHLVVQDCVSIIYEQERIPKEFFYAKPAHQHELAIKKHFGIED